MGTIKNIGKKLLSIHISSRVLFILSIVNIFAVIMVIDLFSTRINEIEKGYELSEKNINRIEHMNTKIEEHDKVLKIEDSRKAVSFSMFTEFGVIGDSWGNGYIDGIEYPSLSWGQILARRNGNTCVNFSRGGCTTRSWLNEEEVDVGLKLLKESEPMGLYLLNLGINDSYTLGIEYLGSIEDINKNYPEANRDTFFGNYGKIIEAIKQKNPNAKIIMLTMASNTEYGTEMDYNDAIVKIAEYYEIPCICLYDAPYFKSKLFINNLKDSHPVAATYSGMAVTIEKLIEHVIIENMDYFSDYTG